MPADTDVSFLSEKVILVSGASGTVGSALVGRLLGAGARLGIAAHSSHRARELQEALPRDRVLVAEVGAVDGEAAAGLVKGVEDTFGPIAGFVSTAGAFVAAPVGTERAADVERLLQANLLSVITLVRAVVPPMRRRGSGSIVLTGARAVEEPGPGMSTYLAAKAGVHGYGRALHAELAPHGLRVAVIAPREISESPAGPGQDALADVVSALLLALAGRSKGPGPLYPVAAAE